MASSRWPSSDRSNRAAGGRARSGGWALLTAVLSAMLIGLSATAAQISLRIEREREREQQLLQIGREFIAALRSYRDAVGVTQPELPRQLSDLVDDKRAIGVMRHLRRIPLDPFTGKEDWGLVRQGDRIVGIHSQATRAPLTRRGFPADFADFDKAARLSDWRFVLSPAEPTPPKEPRS
jgi:type II secretory pathway pseudopilin PulG